MVNQNTTKVRVLKLSQNPTILKPERKSKGNKRTNRLKSHYHQTRGRKNKFNPKKTSELFFLIYVKTVSFLPEQIH